MNNNAITKRLVDELYMDLNDILSVDIIVSFVQESGYHEIEQFLSIASAQNIPVRIITSTYMNITTPTALTLLYYAPIGIETFIYTGVAPSFHPKAYIYHHKDKNKSTVFVGSSNLSKAGLTNGIEWNYRISAEQDRASVNLFQAEFEAILTYETIKLDREVLEEYRKVYQYNKEATKDIIKKFYKPVNVRKPEGSKVAFVAEYEVTSNIEPLFKPNSAQTEALLELKNTREEGNEKALVVAATGVGKTFLAAFDSMDSETILFVAHREEILNQAYQTFAKVRGEQELGRFYNGYKDTAKKVIFASIQTLSRKENMHLFEKDFFDYICVDELHHGVAKTYSKVMEYFVPKFLLGLTATPHRLDQKDVFAICDYNSVYEVDLFTSINRGWLVPYKYYGIYDVTVNYDNVHFMNGKYVEKELEKALMIQNRAELVLTHYKRYKRKRALAFCSNINHAEYMAEYFVEKGIKSICIHSDQSRKHYMERNTGIKRLEEGDIEVVFSVDMLSEGVDIASLDLLLFLRPTESPVVFLQQLGRGLRLSEGKSHVRVLDFIGNFKKVELIPFLLGYKRESRTDFIASIQNGENLPLDCQVDFEFQVVDLIQTALIGKRKAQENIEEWFLQCRLENNNQLPTRMDFFNYLDDEQYQLLKTNRKFNPFKDFCGYISKIEDSNVHKLFLSTKEYQFINLIETTAMAQLYKLPVLLTFVTEEGIKNKVAIDEIVDSFIYFYSNNRNRLDIVRNKAAGEPNNYSRSQWKKLILSNPVHFLSKTHDDVFELVGEEFRIKLDFDSTIHFEWFVSNVKDALEFRRCEFLDQRIE